MRRRRWITLSAAASLVLCGAWVALWIASQFHVSTVSWRYPTGILDASSGAGGLFVSWLRSEGVAGPYGVSVSSQPPGIRGFFVRPSRSMYPGFCVAGFAGEHGVTPTGITVDRLVVPHWFIITAWAALPAAWVIRAVRVRLRSRPGACPTCGYDLRATPDRCPECGVG